MSKIDEQEKKDILPMKILFDVNILIDGYTGRSAKAGLYFTAYNILVNFIQNKHFNVTLYCDQKKCIDLLSFLNHDNKLSTLKIFEKITFIDTLMFSLYHARLKSKKYKKISITRLLIKLSFYSVTRLYNMKLRFSSNKYDKMLNHYDAYITAFAPAPLFIQNNKIRKYHLLHDTIPSFFPQYFPDIINESYWYNQILRMMETKQNIHYFTNSACTKKDFLALIPQLMEKDISVALLACAETFYSCPELSKSALEFYNFPTDKKYIFSLCALEPRKNLIRAIKSFIAFIVKHKIDDLIFILGGGQWDFFIKELDKEILNLNQYKHKIVKAGYIEDKHLAPLYSGAEWFVYTSQYEGFGLPPLEAMSCACPVITSNNSSLPEVVGDAGIMIDFDSEEQHIKAYEKYYFNEEYRKEMALKGLTRSKEFSWEKTVDVMSKEIYKNGI